MRNLFVSLSSLSLLAVASCKSSDPDPREQCIGAYNVTATVSGKGTNGAATTSVTKYNVTVAKGSGSDELTFTENGDPYTVKLNSNTFDIPAHYETYTYGNSNYQLKSIGNGSFVGNAININTRSSAYISGITIDLTTTGNGVTYK